MPEITNQIGRARVLAGAGAVERVCGRASQTVPEVAHFAVAHERVGRGAAVTAGGVRWTREVSGGVALEGVVAGDGVGFLNEIAHVADGR